MPIADALQAEMCRADAAQRNLAAALQAEMRRVRDEVLPAYLAIGSPGAFAVASMRAELDAATKALTEHDVVECLRAFKSLRDFNT